MAPLSPQRPGQPPSPADTPSGVHRRDEVNARGHSAPPLQYLLRQAVLPLLPLVLQKVASELHPKVRNHGEGPYYGLLLVESGYYRFHI